MLKKTEMFKIDLLFKFYISLTPSTMKNVKTNRVSDARKVAPQQLHVRLLLRKKALIIFSVQPFLVFSPLSSQHGTLGIRQCDFVLEQPNDVCHNCWLHQR